MAADEKYKASKNNVNQGGEEIEAPQKTQDEINAENNANNLRNAAEVAANSSNPYAKAIGTAVKVADKISGGKATQKMGEAVNKVNKVAPGGKMVQDASNKLNESGASDKIGQAASAKGGGGQKGVKSAGGGSSKSTSTSSSSASGSMGSSGGGDSSLKFLAIGAIGFFLPLLLFITVFAEDDEINLGSTNNTSMSSSGSIGGVPCTVDEIEDKMIYVGDSRTVGMQAFAGKDNIKYIAESGKGYDWLTANALSEIDSKLSENPNSVIVLSLGINDLNNIDNYISEYNNLISKYPDAVFYIMSVNPVDESKTSSNGYSVTNTQIEEFNNKLKQNFPNNYLDSYSSIGNIGSDDGVHYDSDTYNNLHNIVTENIGNSGKVMCGGSGANYLGDVNTCSLTVIGDKYYKTVIPQTNECVVNGFYDNNSWGLEPSFYANIMSLIEDAKGQGCDAAIISGHRTYAKQAALYKKYLNGTGNLAAKPGYGNHEYAIAADLRYIPDNNKCVSYYHNNASKYGLGFPLLNASQPEDWHIEPINIIKGKP